jgi:hypothetical protein
MRRHNQQPYIVFQAEINEFSCNMTAMSVTYKDSGLSSGLFPCSWFKTVLKPFETVLVASQSFWAGTDLPTTRHIIGDVPCIDTSSLTD